MRYVPGLVIGGAAVLTAVVVFGAVRWQGARSTTEAGFWFATDAFALDSHDENRIGGPLSAADRALIAEVARAELVKAFNGLRIVVTDNPSAFWRMEVRRDTSARRRYLPSSAESYGFGPLGGRGIVSFTVLASHAVHFAPPDASRERIVSGIGRGIGRAAAHEFAHQILSPLSIHDGEDADSYEYWHASRASQYYGELHWTRAGPLLKARLAH